MKMGWRKNMPSLLRGFAFLSCGIKIGLLMGVLSFGSPVSAQQPNSAEVPVLAATQPLIKSKAVADFCKRFHRAKTISFSAYLSYDEGPQFGLMTMNTFTVAAKRSNQFAIRGGPTFRYEPTENGRRQVIFLGLGNHNVVICDGKTLLEMDPNDHTYELLSAPLTMEQTSSSAFKLILGSVVLNTDLLIGYEAAPDESINQNRPLVSVFVQKDNTSNKYCFLTNKLYFDQDTGELLYYSQYARDRKTGEEVEHQRVEYDNWKLNVKMDRSLFDTTPPRGARTVEEFLRVIKANSPK